MNNTLNPKLQNLINALKSKDSSSFNKLKGMSIEKHLNYYGPNSVSECGRYLSVPVDSPIKEIPEPEFPSLDSIPVDTASQAKILRELKAWKFGMKGLYVFGNLGSGKTSLLETFAYTLRKNILSKNKTIYEFEYIDLIKGLSNEKEKRLLCSKKMTATKEVATKYWYEYHAKNSDVLFIDDFASMDAPFHPADNLNEIFNYRKKHELPVFFTSNLSVKDVMVNVNARIGDRILKLCKVLECTTDESYRLKSQHEYHKKDHENPDEQY